MVKKGAKSEEILAFIVLLRGTMKNNQVSTHSANSIANRTGMTNYRAKEALAWLESHGYISRAESDNAKSKVRQPKWLISKSVDVVEIPLSNALTDGVGRGNNSPPFSRIYDEIDMGTHCNVSDTRLDTIMLLICMFKHHELAEFGGINPKSGFYRSYIETENGDGNMIEGIAETNAAIFEIMGYDNVISDEFSNEALFYILDKQERDERFSCAFNNLSRLGFLYETIQIWNEDPIKSIKASTLYTLYIFDRHARKTEPYLSRLIHATAMRLGTMDRYVEFSDPDLSENIINTGRFRYVANKNTGGHPIGIFRLRFRPHTRDVGKGLAAEERRLDQWASALRKL